MSKAPSPAYLIARLEVKDHAEYMERYGLPTIAVLRKFSAEVLAASPAPMLLEGTWSSNWTVILRFPSLAIAEEFYRSADYEPLKALRMNELTHGGSVVVVDGFDPAAAGL
jgi:uncharacterized protein (DUF1330 family)